METIDESIAGLRWWAANCLADDTAERRIVAVCEEIRRLRAEGEQARADLAAEREDAQHQYGKYLAENGGLLQRCNIAEAENATLRAQLEAALRRAEGRCILNVESPSFPPDDDERKQCGCEWCLRVIAENKVKELMRAAKALPPLPEGWDVTEAHGVKTWSWRHNPMNDVILRLSPDGVYRVAVDVGWGEELPPVADLITVLRHAEAAHQRLKEEQ